MKSLLTPIVFSNKQYGSVMRFDLLFRRGTIVSSPELVEYLLKTKFDNYIKGDLAYERFMPLLGHGIFNADGALWKVQRKTASHMFNVRTLRDNMSSVFLQHGKQFVAKMEQLRTQVPYIEMVIMLLPRSNRPYNI